MALVVALGAMSVPQEEPPQNPCSKICAQVGTEGPQQRPGVCATIQFEILASEAGSGTPQCGTCTLCKMTVRMRVTCDSSCSQGCTFVWEAHSYNGLDLPSVGAGNGVMTAGTVMRVSQTITTGCNGEPAVFGISVEGFLRVFTLTCPCDSN